MIEILFTCDVNFIHSFIHSFISIPTFAAMCLYVRNDARDPSSERWNCGRERCPVILPKFRLPRKFMNLLHAVNLRHGTDGFTSPPKEGVLRIFFGCKFVCYKYTVMCTTNTDCFLSLARSSVNFFLQDVSSYEIRMSVFAVNLLRKVRV